MTTARPWWEAPPAPPAPAWWQTPAPAPAPPTTADTPPGVYGSALHADDAERYLRDLLTRLGKLATQPR
jgi:hypothetical protein